MEEPEPPQQQQLTPPSPPPAAAAAALPTDSPSPPPPPSIKTPPPSLSSSSSDAIGGGDWTCDDCDNVNFARRTSCNRCHKVRDPMSPAAIAARKRKLGHEIGKAAAEKSRGLFSADDWQCNKCGNVNWARRQQCNVCNAPKFGEVEERTGFGGGYNDRGVVEYKEHEESDDEYDEFGRKKRRKGDRDYDGNSTRRSDDEEEVDKKSKRKITPIGATTQPKSVSKTVITNDEDEEEEDDDDDDDDGDLSKYDLSDWGDCGVVAINKVTNSSRSTKSRSRSKSPLSEKKVY